MTEHARLGASNSATWLNCTASPDLIDRLGAERKASFYSTEGNAAHDLAERMLRGEAWAIGEEQEYDGYLHTFTKEMARHVQVYVDECVDYLMSGSTVTHGIEARVHLDPLWLDSFEVVPESMFGTADFWALNGDTLVLRDLKYGKGVGVEVKGNTQLMYYALGVYLGLARHHKNLVEWVDAGIVQPRFNHPDGPVRSLRMHLDDLLHWAEGTLKQTVDEIHADKVRFKSGAWCRWCPASGSCQHLAHKAQKNAQIVFGSLDNAELGAVLDELDMVSKWVNSVRAEASQRIERGQDIPGWKLVDKRAIRKWANPVDAANQMKRMGLDVRTFMEAKMKTVAAVAQELDAEQYKAILPYIDATSSGTTLAPDTDSREAAPPAPTAEEVFADGEDEAELAALSKQETM